MKTKYEAIENARKQVLTHPTPILDEFLKWYIKNEKQAL
jgi:hypothetical protein